MASNRQSYFPQIDKGIDPKLTVHLQRIYPALNDHDEAIGLLKTQLESVIAGTTVIKQTTTTTSTTSTSGVTSFNSETGAVTYFPYLGTKNDQTGQVTYQLQQSDDGVFLILNDASPIAIDLNSAITTPFFCFIINWGTGTATLTPETPALINYYNNIGALSMPLLAGQTIAIEWDGVNWNAFYLLGGPAGGDLGGQYPNPTVVGIQTTPVDSVKPTDQQVLQYFASTSKWEPSTLTATGNGTYFLDQAASDVASYETLIPTFPASAEFTYSASGTSGSGQVLVAQFVGPPGGMGFQILPAGEWSPSLYLAVDSLTQSPQAIAKIYTRTVAGVETLQATFTINLTATAVTLYDPTLQLSDINVSPTDRMVIKVYLLAGGAATRTLTLYVDGTTHASHIHFPSSSVNRVAVGVIGATIQATDVNKPQYITIPFAATITSWTIIADTSGSASVDVWFIAGSAPPTAPNIPLVANKISASAPIALSSAPSAAGGATAISTWTTALSQWGTLAFNLTSISTSTKVTVQIQVTRS